MIVSHTADLDEVLIHYVEALGPEPALLVLHGITGALDTFRPLLPAMAQQVHVYAIDLRGHNLSGRTPGPYQMAGYGRDAAAFLKEVIGRPAVVAGHSLGGVIAIWLAASHPELVQGLLLEDPPLYITQAPRLQTTPFHGYFIFLRDYLRQHHEHGGTLEILTAFLGQSPANETQTMLEAVGPEGVQRRAIELQRLDPAVLDAAIDGTILGEHDPDHLLAQVHCPIHLLAAQAARGGAMDEQDVQRFIADAPHCTVTVLDGVGHGIHEERPDSYLAALRQFITQHVFS